MCSARARAGPGRGRPISMVLSTYPLALARCASWPEVGQRRAPSGQRQLASPDVPGAAVGTSSLAEPRRLARLVVNTDDRRGAIK